MQAMIAAVIALSLINVAFKGVGPALLGGRKFPHRVQVIIDALPPALLGALLTVDLLGQDWGSADWTLGPGLVIALALRARGRSHVLCIAIAIAATAATRTVAS